MPLVEGEDGAFCLPISSRLFLGIPGFGWVETARRATRSRGLSRVMRSNREEESVAESSNTGSSSLVLLSRLPLPPTQIPEDRSSFPFSSFRGFVIGLPFFLPSSSKARYARGWNFLWTARKRAVSTWV
jgi:hypothetical protein